MNSLVLDIHGGNNIVCVKFGSMMSDLTFFCMEKLADGFHFERLFW